MSSLEQKIGTLNAKITLLTEAINLVAGTPPITDPTNPPVPPDGGNEEKLFEVVKLTNDDAAHGGRAKLRDQPSLGVGEIDDEGRGVFCVLGDIVQVFDVITNAHGNSFWWLGIITSSNVANEGFEGYVWTGDMRIEDA